MITPELLREHLSYDSGTGIVTRKSNGKPLPAPKASVFGTHIQTSHIVWAIYYGKWPDGEVDHKDFDRINNEISNLRDCSRTSNMQSRRWNNPNGKGVTFRGDKPLGKQWQSQIQVNKKKMQLGFFSTKEEAAEAYRQAAIKYHGEFACLT